MEKRENTYLAEQAEGAGGSIEAAGLGWLLTSPELAARRAGARQTLLGSPAAELTLSMAKEKSRLDKAFASFFAGDLLQV